MTATGDLREQAISVRNLAQRMLDDADELVRMADRLDDGAIDATDRFINRSAG